jgi:hypothetical protein
MAGFKRTFSFLITTACFLLATKLALPQSLPNVGRSEFRLFAKAGIPPILHEQVAALGSRAKRPGLERTTLIGTFVDSRGMSIPAVIVQQLPDLLRIEGLKPGGGIIAFDGQNIRGTAGVTAEDEGILETFVSDTPEGMFTAVDEGNGVRLLGRGFRPDPAIYKSYNGPSYDIFEMRAPLKTRTDRAPQTKRYYFETRSGLLLRVRYKDERRSPFPTVETRFSNWVKVGDSSYPRNVERLEDGKIVMSFTVNNVMNGPAQDVTAFRP